MNKLGIQKTQPLAINEHGFYHFLTLWNQHLLLPTQNALTCFIVKELSIAYQSEVILHFPRYLAYLMFYEKKKSFISVAISQLRN